jgi:hypothetical protein
LLCGVLVRLWGRSQANSASPPIFCSTGYRLEVQKKMWSWGILVFAIFVGAVMALIVFGLPLAIIGLFIASILDRRNKRAADGQQKSEFVGPGRSFPVERIRRYNSVGARLKS